MEQRKRSIAGCTDKGDIMLEGYYIRGNMLMRVRDRLGVT